MATFKILKNRLDITNVMSDKNDEILKKELYNLINNNLQFKNFTGEFSFHITGINIAYVYLGNDATIQQLSVLRPLIDLILLRLNLALDSKI